MSILIVGAGPAGSRLAKNLSTLGLRVTLIDKLSGPDEHSFSSAALPLDAIEELKIPSDSISAFTSSWQIFGPDLKKYEWTSDKNIAAVLDFGILRQKLWSDALNAGVALLIGCRASLIQMLNNSVVVKLSFKSGEILQKEFSWVVDATGFSRSFIGLPRNKQTFKKSKLLRGEGLELIIKPNQLTPNDWNRSLTFFLGTKWIEHGYGWIFPMSNDRLKIGVCRLSPVSKSKLKPLRLYLDRLIKNNGLDEFDVIDKHGGVLSSTIERNEDHFNGRIIAVGDAVSTANLLGGEGIRYAIISAEILSLILYKLCKHPSSGEIGIQKKFLKQYEKNLKRKLGWRWPITGRLAKRTWWGLKNEKADMRLKKLINGLHEKASADDISALLFKYRFERYGFRLLPYLMGVR